MEPNLLAPDPNVYVDVWFGTEPNNSANAKWVRVIDANLPEGLNATTYTAYVPPLNAPAPTPYYWKVVSYPNGATGIDPNNSVESLTYEFTSLSEQPAIVVIDTNDMITWIGKPVSINVTITDDGDSPVTLLWTADSTTGVTFDPNEHVEDPIVTITSGTYANALIKNPSFEGGLTDWESVGDGTSETWNGVYYGNIHINPSDGGAIGSIYTGLDVSDSGLSQTLSEPLAAETDYTLTVDVANDGYNGDAVVYYKIQLLAGETVIAEDYSGEYLPLPLYYPADWETSTVEHTSGTAGTDPNVGQSMEIRLLVTSDSTGLTFDNVNLTADPEFPTLSGHTYTLMLTATDNVGSKKDTIEIDVYDTSCQAARIGLSKAAENLGDLDGDCDTDIDDVAAMVLDWLDDTLPTEAIAIP
jgi:hypothetical protein